MLHAVANWLIVHGYIDGLAVISSEDKAENVKEREGGHNQIANRLMQHIAMDRLNESELKAAV